MLPAFSITIFYVAIVARVARASVVERAVARTSSLTAMAKGLSRRAILWRHVLPNAMIPVVTVIGYNFGYSLTGAILVETVFAWPGLGSLFVTSIGNRDYPVLQGIFLLSAVTVVVANLADRPASTPSSIRACGAAMERRMREAWARLAQHTAGVVGLALHRAAASSPAVAAPLLPGHDPAALSQRRDGAAVGARTGSAPTSSGATCFAGMIQGVQVSLTVGFAAALAAIGASAS